MVTGLPPSIRRLASKRLEIYQCIRFHPLLIPRRLLRDLAHDLRHLHYPRLHLPQQRQHLDRALTHSAGYIKHKTLLTIRITSSGDYNFIHSFGGFLNIFEQDELRAQSLG